MGEPVFLSEGADLEWAFVLLKDRLSEVFCLVFTEKMGWTFHRTRDRW